MLFRSERAIFQGIGASDQGLKSARERLKIQSKATFFIFVVLPTLAAAIYFAFVGKSGGAIEPGLLLCFLVALPAPLGVAFYISTTATQIMLRDMTRIAPTPGGLITIIALIGLMLAATGGCLALLSTGAGYCLDAAARLLAEHGHGGVSWLGLLDAATAAPFGAPVSWLPAGMVLCVCAPPLLLIAHGLSSLALAALPARSRALSLLESEPKLSPANRSRAARCLASLDICRFPLRLAFCAVLLAGAVMAARTWGEPSGASRLIVTKSDAART